MQTSFLSDFLMVKPIIQWRNRLRQIAFFLTGRVRSAGYFLPERSPDNGQEE
jgi:hypothetical protein